MIKQYKIEIVVCFPKTIGLRVQGLGIRIQRFGIRISGIEKRRTGSAAQASGNRSLRTLQERPDLARTRCARKQLAGPKIGETFSRFRSRTRPETDRRHRIGIGHRDRRLRDRVEKEEARKNRDDNQRRK